MSTPSTVTATLPPHIPWYSYHQHYPGPSNYQPPKANNAQLKNGYTLNKSSTDLRKTATTNARPAAQNVPLTQTQTPDMPNQKKDERKPDWNEFYKHGLPKEVIVIDDDESPGPHHSSQVRANSASRNVATNGDTRHADKKRKTGASALDSTYQQQALHLNTHSAYKGDSYSSGTNSTDGTSSRVNTTAPTSYTSNTSQGSNGIGSIAGQKRKRATQKVQEEVDLRHDPYSTYVPPPKPPIKAKDVDVAVIPDRSATALEKVDDEDGHYIVHENAPLTERYHIVRLLGQGTFGKVVEAIDRRRNVRCAIKIIRAVPKYRDASRIELRVLSTLAHNDKYNRNKCIHLRDCFDFRNHICIVTDLLGQSVFDFLKNNTFVPFPSTHIQTFARQLFQSVAFLHDLNLIHTDLKPENILLVGSSYQTFTYNRTIPSSSKETTRISKYRKVLLEPEIRLIDFGSATFDDEYHSSVVSTRHYRAPEIILNLGWSFPCDIWSIGCILVEFFTGDALFQTHDNLEHLAMMEAVCGGKIDREIVKQVFAGRGSNKNGASSYFKPRAYVLDYPNHETSRASKRYVKAMKPLHETIPPTNAFNKHFLDLLRRIFVYDPRKRITAKQALQHPWFGESLMDDGTEATKIRLERERARFERKGGGAAAAGGAVRMTEKEIEAAAAGSRYR